ncbi:MAG: ester cyclase [Proteobacteria bacterium]|nr:ester cyclase [Pseudomonadota bacterium]
MNIEQNQLNKRVVWDFWQALENTTVIQAEEVARSAMDAHVIWHGPDPINELSGVGSFMFDFWLPLLHSFHDLKRQSHLFFGGKSNGRIDGDVSLDGNMWVGGTGYLNGAFAHDYLTIPATGGEVNIRWGEFCRMEQGKIVEVYFLLDLIDLMQQAGYYVLPPSRGQDGLYPPPHANDGIMLGAHDAWESAYSLDHIRRFIFDGLNSYDQAGLESMGMADFFHPDVQWYGPGGIGACLSLKEFEDLHQEPWLHAFPDRQVQDLDALIAEGGYSGAPGWAGVKATHTGRYLDCPATGNQIEVNGLDWWKREEDMYVENWVFVDMVHLFRQFDVDLFRILAQHIEQKS